MAGFTLSVSLAGADVVTGVGCVQCWRIRVAMYNHSRHVLQAVCCLCSLAPCCCLGESGVCISKYTLPWHSAGNPAQSLRGTHFKLEIHRWKWPPFNLVFQLPTELLYKYLTSVHRAIVLFLSSAPFHFFTVHFIFDCPNYNSSLTGQVWCVWAVEVTPEFRLLNIF